MQSLHALRSTSARAADRKESDLELRLGDVLRKISESGKDSLTAEEWEVLERASGNYRKRDET